MKLRSYRYVHLFAPKLALVGDCRDCRWEIRREDGGAGVSHAATSPQSQTQFVLVYKGALIHPSLALDYFDLPLGGLECLQRTECDAGLAIGSPRLVVRRDTQCLEGLACMHARRGMHDSYSRVRGIWWLDPDDSSVGLASCAGVPLLWCCLPP